MKVIVWGFQYKVWDVNDPDKHRYLVSKSQKCTCQYVKCEHVRAVREYLQRGGKRAPDETYDPRGTLESQIIRIRALRERRIQEKALGVGAEAILSAYRASSAFEYAEWQRRYVIQQMWAENV